MLKQRTFVGDPQKPLLIAYHGFTQRSTGLGAKLPWFWSFPHNSQLEAFCKQFGWSCSMPQAPFTNWRPADVKLACAQVLVARSKTKSRGKLVIFGFSDGGTLAHGVADELMCCAMDDLYRPVGLWVHSGLSAGTKSNRHTYCDKYKVAITCNESETAPLPFNKGKSMQDERLIAYDWYHSRGYQVQTLEGHAKGHRCDPGLNKTVLQWLVV